MPIISTRFWQAGGTPRQVNTVVVAVIVLDSLRPLPVAWVGLRPL